MRRNRIVDLGHQLTKLRKPRPGDRGEVVVFIVISHLEELVVVISEIKKSHLKELTLYARIFSGP